MKSHSFTIALMNLFAFGAACGSSAINGIAETTEDRASNSVVASESGLGSRPCTRSNTSRAPADGLIADFTKADGGGIKIPGALVTYAAPKVAGLGSATYTTGEGALNVKVNAVPTSTPQFLGVAVAFNSCIDASAFTGVQFTIRGSLSGCTMQYATGDVAHQDMTFASPYATAAAGSYPPQHRIAVDELRSVPRIIKAPFAAADIQGSPPVPLDASKLISAIWNFIVPVAAEGEDDNPPCTGSLTVDDVKFYR